VAAAVSVEILMVRWNRIERGAYPYLILLQGIPVVATASLLVVWLGPGMQPATPPATTADPARHQRDRGTGVAAVARAVIRRRSVGYSAT
jgi:hypothetical protein